LDCYLLHWRGEYPIKETVAAFRELLDRKMILSWGVSNFDVSDMEEAWDAAGEDRKFACNQVLYHLKERSIEYGVLPWCERHGVAVMAYSPFGHGDFPDPQSREGRVLKEIADSHHATPRQVALAFLTRRPSVFAIPKSSAPEHVVENAGASGLHLTRDELARIDESFPLGPRPSSLPML
jgi:diketogulonate reductase-like aldo/keto reductase